jgi:hypothetical protein
MMLLDWLFGKNKSTDEQIVAVKKELDRASAENEEARDNAEAAAAEIRRVNSVLQTTADTLEIAAGKRKARGK